MAVIKARAGAAAVAVAAPQFRATVDTVRIEALVTDGGRPVAGLTAADIVLTDNGTPETITVRPLGRDPIDVAIALDVSASLQGEPLERLRAGALALVAQLGAGDRATLVWVAGRERPVLALIFSDGRATASWTRADQALALARRSDAVVDVVVAGELVPSRTMQRPRVDTTRRLPSGDERFLGELAIAPGGRARDGDAGEGLAGAFKASLEQFRARYEITYEPSGKDPGLHAVEIAIKGRRGLTVRARRGYQR